MQKNKVNFLLIIGSVITLYIVIFLCFFLAMTIGREITLQSAITSAIFIFVTMLVPVGIMFWLTIIAIVGYLMFTSKNEKKEKIEEEL